MRPALLQRFANLDDPRLAHTRLHSLTDLLDVALCAVICGADIWIEIEAYGHAKQDWLQLFTTLDAPALVDSDHRYPERR